MKIRHRLIVWNAIVVLLVMSVGIFGLLAGNNVASTFKNEEKHFRSIITSATETASYAKRAEGHLILFLTLSEPVDKQKFLERYDSLVEEVKILNHAVKIPEARELVEGIRTNTEKLLPEGKSLLRAHERDISTMGKFSPARYSGEIREFADTSSEIRNLGVKLAIFEADQNFKSHSAALEKASRLQIYSMVIIAFAVIIALFQGYLLSRKISIPLTELKNKVAEVAEGNLDANMAYLSEDEIGDLTRSFNTMTTALRNSHAEILSEKEQLHVTLRSIGDGVITTDVTGNIVLMNAVAGLLTGWTEDEAAGRPLMEVLNIVNYKTRAACTDPVAQVIKEGKISEAADNAALISKDGSERLISSNGSPILDNNEKIIGVVLVFRDVTEKQKMENELVRRRNIESLGILAGGIAHDFNNILVGILGNISLAKRRLEKEDKEKVLDRLSGIEKAAQRAKDLTHQLLTFSKGGAPILKTTIISGLIRDSVKFVLAGSNVMCHFSFPENLWPVDIDRGQLSQVIHNLAMNAKWAMPEGGLLKISADNLDHRGGSDDSLPAGKYIRISVRDEGIGIPQENLSRIFDPYFTTRDKGSGLGLATVYSIIKRHKGTITTESSVGVGTVFHLYLPASEHPVIAEERQKISGQGKGRILIMDDDDIVREVTESMLTDLGYEPILAINGDEAVGLYRQAMHSDEPFSAVVLDLTIPGGMGGKETIQELLKIDPAVKAIVSSGYSEDPVMAEHERYGFMDVIKKPYSIDEISASLQRVLG